MKKTVSMEIVNYADIPIPQFVDIILKGDDEAMYYLLHERLKHLLYERYQDYSHNLYDDFDDLLDDFFIYIRESEHTPYQALQRIKRKQAFESWLLNTFRNYLNNRSEAESHLTILNEQQAVPDKEMAEALGMSYISYRVTLHHMRSNVKRFRECLLNGESLRLDNEHELLAKRIDNDFPNLYPILFNCYIRCIDTLKPVLPLKSFAANI